MKRLKPDEKIDVMEILKDLDQYRPKRKGWTWRKLVRSNPAGPFELRDTSEGLKRSVPLPSAHYFDDIDPLQESSFTIKDRYNGDIPVILTGRYMAGIIDGAENPDALKNLEELVKNLAVE